MPIKWWKLQIPTKEKFIKKSHIMSRFKKNSQLKIKNSNKCFTSLLLSTFSDHTLIQETNLKLIFLKLIKNTKILSHSVKLRPKNSLILMKSLFMSSNCQTGLSHKKELNQKKNFLRKWLKFIKECSKSLFLNQRTLKVCSFFLRTFYTFSLKMYKSQFL